MKTIINRGKIVGLISIGLVTLIIITSLNLFTACGQPASPASPVGGTPDETDAPKILKTGIVNMVEVFDKFKKREEYTVALEKEKAEEHKKIKQIEEEILKLKKEIDAFEKAEISPDSPLRAEKEMKIKILSLQMENMVKSWNNYINKKVNEQTVVLYNTIREAIDKYAQEQGFDLILKTDPKMEENSEESATLRINTRTVLYATKALDITAEIIKIVNKE